LFLLLLFWLPSLNLWFHELLLFLSEEDQYHPAGKDPQRFDDDLMIRSALVSALTYRADTAVIRDEYALRGKP